MIIGTDIEYETKTKLRLIATMLAFERQYKMSSTDFYARFENGELGDAIDFMEWSSTIEMLDNLNKQIENSQD